MKTAAAQYMDALNSIQEQFNVIISWGAWLLYAAPFSIIMSVALFFIMIALIKPQTSNIEGGKEVIKKQLSELGPLKAPEIRLIITTIVLLFFWATKEKLHP
ncbi:anion permease, partial [Lysinibacillus fusiformis]|uniref:anion permease n=1 Tax=Lysinibacillus fusiformis TaxID=28031 RepID=UPI0030BA1D9B